MSIDKQRMLSRKATTENGCFCVKMVKMYIFNVLWQYKSKFHSSLVQIELWGEDQFQNKKGFYNEIEEFIYNEISDFLSNFI